MIITDTSKNRNNEWLFGGNPKAILNQEIRGQQELVNSSQLPRDTNMSNLSIEEFCKKNGIKIDGDGGNDELFINVILPNGWKFKSTEHSMWNNLIDDIGRERASIFYKAAFYDRSALINFNKRYNISIDNEYSNGVSDASRTYERINNTKVSYFILDGYKIIYKLPYACFDLKYDENEHTKWWDSYNEFKKEKITQCKNWLNKNYPKWENECAYWD